MDFRTFTIKLPNPTCDECGKSQFTNMGIELVYGGRSIYQCVGCGHLMHGLPNEHNHTLKFRIPLAELEA